MKNSLSKRAAIVLLAFVYAILFAGCGEKTIYGEVVPASDLFTCEPDELTDRITEICKVDDEVLLAEMKDNFKLEYVIFFPDNLEITFPAGALPEYGTSYGIGFDYSEEGCTLLQPWAIPNGSGLE